MTGTYKKIKPNQFRLIEDVAQGQFSEDRYSSFQEFDGSFDHHVLIRAKIISSPEYSKSAYYTTSKQQSSAQEEPRYEEVATFKVRASVRTQTDRGNLIEICEHEVVVNNQDACLFRPQSTDDSKDAPFLFEKGSYVLLKGSYLYQEFSLRESDPQDIFQKNVQHFQRSVVMISEEGDYVIPNYKSQRVPGWVDHKTPNQNRFQKQAKLSVFDAWETGEVLSKSIAATS